MSIRKTIIAAVATLALVATIAPISASAITTAELMAQIQALTAQLNQLSGTTTTTTTGSAPAACAGVTFSRNLTVGSTGSDVKCLQAVLNLTAATKVAATGAGSPGNETTYFGPATLRAVKAFQSANGMTPANQVGPMTRAKLNSMIAGGTTTTTTPGTTVPTGAGLTVALASNNPASGTVVSNQGLALLANVSFANGDNATVKVTGVKLKRIGVSADTSLSNVYLFDGANRLTDAASVSSGVISFNDSTGIFTVNPFSSKTISVYADMNASSGETLGVAVNAASDITSNASSVNGTFPVEANKMSVATATLAGVSFATSTTPTTASVDPANDVTVWENLTTVTTRATNFSWLRLREIGTINYSDLGNFRLYVDGVQVGASVASLDSNGYVTFDLTAAPKRLEAGQRDIKVLADVIGGSSRTYSFSLRTASDAKFVDTQYGANVLVQANNTTFSARTTGTMTLNSGTITITKTTDSPSGNVVDQASNAVLARYTIKAAGEKVKVENLNVAVVCSDASVSYLRNGMILANGVQVGSTSNLLCTGYSTGYTTFNLGSSLVVDPTSPVTLEVRADIYDNDGTNNLGADDTLQARIVTGSNNGTGQTSLTLSNVPASAATANQLTVKVGGLTLSKYTAYTNQTTVAPKTAYKLGHFTLTADTTESVNVSSIEVDFTSPSPTPSLLNNVYVTYDTNTTSIKPTVGATNTWSVNYVLTPGKTINLAVYADASSSMASGTSIARVLVTGTTASSGTAVQTNSNTTLAGQTVNFSTGSFYAVKDGGPAAGIVSGVQSIPSAAFKFTALNDSYSIKELKFAVGSAAISAGIFDASLKDGSTVLSTAPFDTSSNTVVYFKNLNIPVTANGYKKLEVVLNLSNPTADASTSQINVATTLTWMKYADSQGVEVSDDNPSDSTSIAGGTDPVGSNIYVYRSIPTFTVSALPSTVLSTGNSQTYYKFSVKADAKGPVAIKQLKFNAQITDGSGGGTEVLDTFKLMRNGTSITNLVTIQDASANDLESSSDYVVEGSNTVIVTFDTEEVIEANSTNVYELQATSTAFASSTSGKDSVSVSLLGDTSAHNGSDIYLWETGGTSETAIQKLAGNNSGAGASDYNVIWSDISANAHSYTIAASSADWANGYLVLSLPLDSTSLIVP